MPLYPDEAQMAQVQSHCLTLFDQGEPLTTQQVADSLLALPELPMHFPYHHYLLPAALLTAAHLRTGSLRAKLEADLNTAKERASLVPGGSCGHFGCCGAGVGAGIFASVWQKTIPVSKKGWAAGNEMTARCLSAIATVEGPRCCKRVTYLALSAAVPAAQELLGLDLGEVTPIRCTYHDRNRECRGANCPFFPL